MEKERSYKCNDCDYKANNITAILRHAKKYLHNWEYK